MRRFLVGALGLLATLVSAKNVELDIPVFAGGYGTEFYVRAARAFEREHPGVTVNVYGDPRIHDQIRVRAIDGHYPDAACAAYVQWPTLVAAGKVLALDSALAGPNWERDTRWAETFLPGALDNWRIDGHVYGLPVSFSCWTLFYNRAMFREHGWTIPQTWDEFFALCDRIKAAGIAPVSVPGIRWLYADAFFRSAYYDLVGAQGWSAMNELAPGARSDPRYARAAAIEQRVTQQYALRGWEGESHTGAELSFFQGRSAMTVSGSWLTNEMAGKIPADFELGAMNFPVFPDGVADPTTIQVSSDCFFAFRTGDPERERLTLDFLRYLTSRAQAREFVRTFDSPAAVRGIPVAAYSAGMKDTAAMIARAREAFPMRNAMQQPPYVRQALNDESNRLTLGTITPAEYGRRLEDAAARDRALLAHPDTVDVRHLVAGTILLAAVATILLWSSGMLRWRAQPSPEALAKGDGRSALDTRPTLPAATAATFVLPAFVLYAVLVLAPAVTALTWAFTRWDGIGPREWVGWFNFKSLLFGTDLFWQALGHNLFLMVVPAVMVVPVALLCATLLHRGIWGEKIFRMVFLFPNLLGGVAATLIWLSAYEPHGGLVNAGICALGRLIHNDTLSGFDGFPWLATTHLYTALMPIYLWMACGFNLILYLAAMESIDPQLYEAAALDGASEWRQFFTITLPLIREIILVSAVFLVIAGLNAFEMIWLMTQQDPSAEVHTLSTLLVSTMFKDFAIGRAAALAVLLFLLVLAGSAAMMRLLRKEAIES